MGVRSSTGCLDLLQSFIAKMLFPAPKAETQMMMTLSAMSGCGGVHCEALRPKADSEQPQIGGLGCKSKPTSREDTNTWNRG
jgi:hypothetical protein